jgi:hypothetical protein
MAVADLLTMDEEIDAAFERAQHAPDMPAAISAAYNESLDAIVIVMEGGRRLLLPRLELQDLENATPAQLSEIEIHAGIGLAWPQLDVDHYLHYLIAGQYGSNAWMRSLESRGRPDEPRNSGFAVAKLKAFYDMYPLMGPLSHLNGKILRAVEKVEEAGNLKELVLRFDHQQIVVRAVAWDDSIEAVREKNYLHGHDIGSEEPWTDFVGREMGWGWLGMNPNGYIDTVVLAQNGESPSLLIKTEGSKLKLYSTTPLKP